MIIVELTREESAACEECGRERQRLASKHGFQGIRKMAGGPAEMYEGKNIQGCKGEGAVQKTFGMKVAPNLFPSGDKGWGDVQLPSGKFASVRTLREKFSNLHFCQPESGLKDDYGILVVGDVDELVARVEDGRRWMLVSYITREEFIARAKKIEYGGQRQWSVNRYNMRPIEELVEQEAEFLRNSRVKQLTLW